MARYRDRGLSKTEIRELRKARPVIDQQYREWQAAQPADPKKPRRTSSRSQSSAVTITRSDGSAETRPALTAAQLRWIAPERLLITPSLRARVLSRDRATCRYCLTTVGPFEIDHVIPVAHGGATKLWNLVTACTECNRRKSAQIWRPKPLALVERLSKELKSPKGRRRVRRG